jgi:enoyl-CoA hydratase/carnithine racemase
MSETDSCIQFSIHDQIAWITLDNPAKHNALALVDINALVAALDTIENNNALRALVLTGNGNKTFCAGASLEELSSGELNGNHFEQLTDKLASMRIPTICALNGSAFGGGAELGLCCDFRIGISGMKLMVPAARFGLCYPVNGIERYVQRLGLTAAKRILVISEEFDSAALLHIGYLTHLVAREELQHFTGQLAQSISHLAPLAVRSMKQLSDQFASGSADPEQAKALALHCNQSQDLEEGLRARAEKRKPVFMGC